jgi:tetratricopeptide (TPR) repeat protein
MTRPSWPWLVLLAVLSSPACSLLSGDSGGPAGDGGATAALQRLLDPSRLVPEGSVGPRELPPTILTEEVAKGLVYEGQRQWSAARQQYSDAAARQPGSLAAVIAQARTYHAERRPWDAANLLESSARDGGSSPELLNAAGDAILASGSAAMAAPYYHQALAARPQDLGLAIDFAVAAFLQQRYAEVVGALGNVPPEQLPPPVALMLGRAALLTNQGTLAVTTLYVYLRTAPQDLAAWCDLARGMLLSGRDQEARKVLEEVLRVDARTLDALVLLGHVHSRAGLAEAALMAYDEALRLGANPVVLQPVIDRLRPR